ncbi:MULTISPECIES: UxaA family hydrolase [unclassified Paenibacillus]|uniref:UxaA family hydrolase n=1 Tax=unclassified Paenibacillus TaxID=185978 RepID=UPI00362F79B8
MTDCQIPVKAIVLHGRDNVATALLDMSKETVVSFTEQAHSVVTLLDDVPFGHKFALIDLQKGEKIFKYGVPIGKVTHFVKTGEHVHLHNLVTLQRKEEAR